MTRVSRTERIIRPFLMQRSRMIGPAFPAAPPNRSLVPLRETISIAEATAADVRRVVSLWSGLIGRFGGPFLLGDWSIADAFFTPVATRFRTYGLRLSDHGDTGAAGSYGERLLETPEFLEWEKAALEDVKARSTG